LLLAVVAFALFGWRDYAASSAPPGGLAFAILLAGSFLLLIPSTAVFEVLLRSALQTLDVHLADVRESDAVTVHGLIKNAARILVGQARGDDGIAAETMSLINGVLAASEEARLAVLGDDATPDSVELLWKVVSPIVPHQMRGGVYLEPSSYEAQMSPTDYQLARRVLPDLITNAWKAGATDIRVAISNDRQPASMFAGKPNAATQHTSWLRGSHWVTIEVADDGPGIPPGPIFDQGSSLQVMQSHLQRLGGAVLLTARASGGTTARALWRSRPW